MGGVIFESTISLNREHHHHLIWELVDMQIIRLHLKPIKLKNAWVWDLWFNQHPQVILMQVQVGGLLFGNLVTVHSML